MNQLENCQARYRSNTWMGRTRTDGPDEFEPSKFDCITKYLQFYAQKFCLSKPLICDVTRFYPCPLTGNGIGKSLESLMYVQGLWVTVRSRRVYRGQ